MYIIIIRLDFRRQKHPAANRVRRRRMEPAEALAARHSNLQLTSCMSVDRRVEDNRLGGIGFWA